MSESVKEIDVSLRAMLDAIPSRVFLKDGETGKVVYCNEACAKALGCTAEQIIGRTSYDLFSKEQAGQHSADDELVLLSGQKVEMTLENETGSAGKHVFHTTKTRYVDPNGRVYILGLADDVTDLAVAMQDLEDRNLELSVYQKLNRSVSVHIEYNKDAQDFMDTKKTDWSENAADFFVVEGREGARPVELMDLIPEEDRKILIDTLNEGVRSKEPVREFSCEFRSSMGSDKNRWYLFTGEFRLNPETSSKELFGLISDINDTKENQRLTEELKVACEAAKSANEAKTRFLFNMSHDIRTPMNAIIGYTSMAKKYAEEPDRVRDYLGKVEISGHQLLDLINQVLEMSRIESGKVVLREDEVNIRENLENLETILKTAADAKNIDFSCRLADVSHEDVLTDASRLSQILLNVISNAVKYTLNGGRVSCTVREEETDQAGVSRYVYTVEDTGIGMSKEFVEHIFEEFSRENTSTVSKVEGTGLGMTIVRKLTDLMNGTVSIESEQGIGTTVTISLPLKYIEKTASDQKKEEDAEDISIEGMRILVAEDNEMNREIAKVLLEECGVIVDEVEDGEAAVEKIKNAEPGQYDLVLMDIQMPKMNGYEATKQIRALEDPEKNRIPIIAMTANAFEEDRRAAFAAGMNEHIAKPISEETLKKALKEFK